MTERTHPFWPLAHGLLITLLLIFTGVHSAFRIWPANWVASLAAYFLIVFLVPPLRATFQPWRVGKITPFAITATLIIIVISCAALVLFQHYTGTDLRKVAVLLPIGALGVIGTGIIFPVFNAFFEEVVFRGILFDAIPRWTRWLPLVVTSVLFGLGHMQGYPPGPLGAVLSGVYGASLGYLRILTGGLALPIAAHVTADATIYLLVARSGVI